MTARDQSAPAVHARAVLATGAIMAGTLTAHSWADGALPASSWLVVCTGLVFGASLAVFKGSVSRTAMLLALGAAQCGLHAVLTLAASPDGHAAGHHSAGPAPATSLMEFFALDWRMVLAHGLSVVLTAVVWCCTAQALNAATQLPDPRPLMARRDVGGVRAAGEPVPAPWLDGAPLRGPPLVGTLQHA